MLKFALMAVVVGAGMFLGLHETPDGTHLVINAAEAQAVPAPGVLALLGIGGLGMLLGRKRKN